jgi:hypothetical protein
MSTAQVGIASLCEVHTFVLYVSVSYTLSNVAVCLCEMSDRPAFKHKRGYLQQRQEMLVLIDILNNIGNNFSDKPVGWVPAQTGTATVVRSSLILSAAANVRSVSSGGTTNSELRYQ